MRKTKIEIPYAPRYPQDIIHEQMESHRFSVLVAHRRLGKTVLSINHLIKQAIVENKHMGLYAYVAPFRNQAKLVAWNYLKHFSSPVPGRKINEQELSLTLPNQAQIRIFGADKPDALRGIYLDGVVIDEVAQIKPEVWDEIIRPELSDRNGWAVFIGTPKGINKFYEIYQRALARMQKGDKEWIALKYDYLQSHVLDEKEVASMREDMSENAFRQELLCDFNASQDDALISIDEISAATARTYKEFDYRNAPIVLGVDVARFGDDSSVIFRRQGLVAFEPLVFRNIDNMELANRVAIQISEHNPDAVFIDLGAGQGVIDRLRQLNFKVVEVPFGGRANNSDLFANRRTEMWWEMAQWVKRGGAIPPNTILQSDLGAPTYAYNSAGKIILESKDRIKERLGRSPDLADALALTFAAPVRPKLDKTFERQLYHEEDYDPDAAFEHQWRR